MIFNLSKSYILLLTLALCVAFCCFLPTHKASAFVGTKSFNCEFSTYSNFQNTGNVLYSGGVSYTYKGNADISGCFVSNVQSYQPTLYVISKSTLSYSDFDITVNGSGLGHQSAQTVNVNLITSNFNGYNLYLVSRGISYTSQSGSLSALYSYYKITHADLNIKEYSGSGYAYGGLTLSDFTSSIDAVSSSRVGALTGLSNSKFLRITGGQEVDYAPNNQVLVNFDPYLTSGLSTSDVFVDVSFSNTRIIFTTVGNVKSFNDDGDIYYATVAPKGSENILISEWYSDIAGKAWNGDLHYNLDYLLRPRFNAKAVTLAGTTTFYFRPYILENGSKIYGDISYMTYDWINQKADITEGATSDTITPTTSDNISGGSSSTVDSPTGTGATTNGAIADSEGNKTLTNIDLSDLNGFLEDFFAQLQNFPRAIKSVLDIFPPFVYNTLVVCIALALAVLIVKIVLLLV